MNYKIYLYAICLFFSIYVLSGVNFEKFMRKNKVMEARFLVLALSMALSYLLCNFVTDIIGL